QLTQLGEIAEVFLDRVKVLRVVTVKARAGFPILQFNLVRMIVVVVPGRQPNSRDAEVLQIWQPIDYALQIAAVVVKLVLAIVDAARLGRLVVRTITIAEAIDHDQVHNVGGREALKATGPIERRQDLKKTFSGSAGGSNL